MHSEALYLETLIRNEPSQGMGRFVRLSTLAHSLLLVMLVVLAKSHNPIKKAEMITIDLVSHFQSRPKGRGLETPLMKLKMKPNQSDLKSPVVNARPALKVPPRSDIQNLSRRKTRWATTKRAITPRIQPRVATIDDLAVEGEKELSKMGHASTASSVVKLSDSDFEKDFQAIDAKSQKEMIRTRELLAHEEGEIATEVESRVSQAQSSSEGLKARAGRVAGSYGEGHQEVMRNEEAAFSAKVGELHGFADGLGSGANPPPGQGSAYGAEGGGGGGPGGYPDGNNIRALADLRQMPGNPRPQYGVEERLKRHQGQVIYIAYVGPGGRLSDFSLAKSSGYPSLDKKTLEALRRWRFYPGQEGWVQLPFRWDLKGGIVEMPATLRTKAAGKQRVGQSQ